MAIRPGRELLQQDVAKTKKEIEDAAWRNMQKSASQWGNIIDSEYENNMNPVDQSKYEKLVYNELYNLFNNDPYKKGLPFNHWVSSIDIDSTENKAARFDTVKNHRFSNNIFRNMDPQEASELHGSGILQRLAHLHTGRIEDLIEIAKNIHAKSDSTLNTPK